MADRKRLTDAVMDGWYPSPGIIAALEASASVPTTPVRVMFRTVVQWMLFQELREAGYLVYPSHPQIVRKARLWICAAEDDWLARGE
jgi:hypothetical protein